MKKILVVAIVMALFINPVFDAKSVDSSARAQVSAPEGTIKKVKVLEDGSVKVRYNLIDQSNVLLNNDTYSPEVSVYKGEKLVKAKPATVGEDQVVKFKGLNEDVKYKAVLSGPYDMLGMGTPTNSAPYELDSKKFIIPSEKAIPTANIHLTTDENPTVLGKDSIEVHYDLIDEDSALINEGSVGPRVIIRDAADDSIVYVGTLSVGENQIEKATELEKGHTYGVAITGQYDLNNDGIVENEAPYVLDYKEFSLEESKGNLEWMDIRKFVGLSYFKDVVETTDGGYVTVGRELNRLNLEKDDYYGIAEKHDADGNVEWQKTHSETLWNVEATADGGFIASAVGDRAYDEEDAGMLIKFDNKGNVEWKKDYFENNIHGIKDILVSSDNGYVILDAEYGYEHPE